MTDLVLRLPCEGGPVTPPISKWGRKVKPFVHGFPPKDKVSDFVALGNSKGSEQAGQHREQVPPCGIHLLGAAGQPQSSQVLSNEFQPATDSLPMGQ